MNADKGVRRVLANVGLRVLDGPFHRCVGFKHLYRIPDSPSATPRILSGEWSKAYGGRFTPVDSFLTCYLSLDAATAIREAERLPAPSVHCTIEGRLSAIMDLTDPAVLLALGITQEDLESQWALASSSGAEPLTHQLGRLLFAAKRIEGAVVASVIATGGKNVVVFPERLGAGSWLRIQDPDELLREAIGDIPVDVVAHGRSAGG